MYETSSRSHSPNLQHNCREGQMFRKFIQFILVDVWSNQSIVIQMREEMFEPVPNDPKRRKRYSTRCRGAQYSTFRLSMLIPEKNIIFVSSSYHTPHQTCSPCLPLAWTPGLHWEPGVSSEDWGVTTALWCRRRGNELISEVITFIKWEDQLWHFISQTGPNTAKTWFISPVFLCHLELEAHIMLFSSSLLSSKLSSPCVHN